MTIRSLEIFVKVAECGKMSEVARNMYITQSSVS
ncbi:LysR family transcriptional regulator [Clostridioides difficile]|nr:LysR family transcriptional regulator [Clostridioides difficile]MDV9250676.1 LysR family transcriptional regulator [Clostridioides difficile]